MSCFQYSGPITVPSQEPVTLPENSLRVYDVVIPTCNEAFRHTVSVALFVADDELQEVLQGSYFIFTRVFINDFDIGESGHPPKLIFWLKHVSRVIFSSFMTD